MEFGSESGSPTYVDLSIWLIPLEKQTKPKSFGILCISPDVDIGPKAFKTYQRKKGKNAQLQPSLWMDGYFLIMNCEGSEDPLLDVDFKEGPPLDRELMKIQQLDDDGHDVRMLKSHHRV